MRRGVGGQRGGGGGRIARGGGDRKRRPSREEQETTESERNSNNNSSGIVGLAPPAHHYDVRKAIRGALNDEDFKKVCIHFGNVVVAVETILDPICYACDAVCYQEPFTAPIDEEELKVKVNEAFSRSANNNNSEVGERFANLFCSRVIGNLKKLEKPKREEEETEGEDNRSRGAPRRRLEAPPTTPVDASEPPAYPMTGGPNQNNNNHNGLLPSPVGMARPQAAPSMTAFTNGCLQVVGRCVTFENVPLHFCTTEAMRPHLQQLCSSLRNVFYLDTHCEASRHLVVASFSTNIAASEIIQRVNYQSRFDGSPLIARPALDGEVGLLWDEKRKRLQEVEKEAIKALEEYDAHPANELYQTVEQGKVEIAKLDEQFQSLPEEDKAGKVNILRAKCDASKKVQHALQTLQHRCLPLERPLSPHAGVAGGEAPHDGEVGDAMISHSDTTVDPVTGEHYNSSSANASNSQVLLYLSNFPSRFSDGKLLTLFSFLEMKVMHVWRSPNPTCFDVCIAVPVVSVTFGILRTLDPLDMTFCGIKFSKTHPSKI